MLSGSLHFPTVAGASGDLVYNAQSSIPANTTFDLATLICFSSIPHPTGRHAKTQLAFTIAVSRQSMLMASQIAARLPTGTTAAGPYGFEIFDGHSATAWSEELAASLNAGVVSTAVTTGLWFSAGHTYVVEVVQNPDISQLPPTP